LLSEESCVTEAVRLGKETLRNPELVKRLWEKFGSQSKIAKLIGVNRSTVYRRLQELQLAEGKEIEQLPRSARKRNRRAAL
jgi:DNA invertase Pin-like site-specific DNA recombinase